MSETPRFDLPLLSASQAQKHVTHNEALVLIDALVNAWVLDRDLATPPGVPTDGDTYLVAASPTGAWAGQAGSIAFCIDGGWRFYTPFRGLVIYVADEQTLLVHNGTAFVDYASVSALQNVPMLGINTTADTTNRLAVRSNAALFTALYAADGGNGDFQHKFNKETAGDTASQLYQTNFSGRAETGLTGDDNFHIKVSPDGAAWTEALVIDKTTGTLRTVAGTVSVPAVQIGDADTGLWQTSTFLHVSVDAAEVGAFNSLKQLVLGDVAANTVTAAGFIGNLAGGGNLAVRITGEGQVTNTVERYIGNTGAPAFQAIKGRGTIAGKAAVQNLDSILNILGIAYNGSGNTTAGSINLQIVETTPSSSAMGSRLFANLNPAGSVTQTEIFRFDHATGFSMYGANVVIDQNRNPRHHVYTIGTLPSHVAGLPIHCTDLGGGAGELESDGTNWRRHSEGQQAVATDAAFTLTHLTSAQNQKHTGTLTANRVITLATAGTPAGARFRVARTGAGAFNLDVGGLKNLTTGTWAEVTFDGTAWYLSANGTL